MLGVLAAGFDALVAEDALRVVAYVQVVVVAQRFEDPRDVAAKPRRVAVVRGEVRGELGRRGGVDRRREHLEDDLAGPADALGVRPHPHPGFHAARAGRHEGAAALHLYDTGPADVDRRQVGMVAEGGRVHAGAPERLQDRHPLVRPEGPPVDLDDNAHTTSPGRPCAALAPPLLDDGAPGRSASALSTAPAAV